MSAAINLNITPSHSDISALRGVVNVKPGRVGWLCVEGRPPQRVLSYALRPSRFPRFPIKR